MKEIRFNRILIILLGIIVLLGISAISYAQIPRTVSYQGYLTDTGTGDPVDSSPGTVSMTFTIYDALSLGTSQWTETQNVAVNQGVYSVIFGAIPANPLTATFDTDYYLEIEVETTPGVYETLLPRQALTSVPYAINADTVDGQHATDLGDITGVLPGTGITGGGLSGTVTIGIGVPLVLTNNGTPPHNRS